MVSVEVKQQWNQQSFAVRQAIEKNKNKNIVCVNGSGLWTVFEPHSGPQELLKKHTWGGDLGSRP